MKAIFHPEAYEEMVESARFFEGKSEGLGIDFLRAVEDTTHRIEDFPHAAPIGKGISAGDSYQVSRSRFFTRYTLIESSSRP